MKPNKQKLIHQFTNDSNTSNQKHDEIIFDKINFLNSLLKNCFAVLTTLLLIFLITSLLSFSIQDPSWSRTSYQVVKIYNLAGSWGAYCADILYYILGFSAWMIVFFLFFMSLNLFFYIGLQKHGHLSYSIARAVVGLIFTLLSGPIIEQLFFQSFLQNYLPLGAGGLIGNLLVPLLNRVFNIQFSKILAIVLFILGLLLIIQISWIYLFQAIKMGIQSSKKILSKNEKEKTIDKANLITQSPISKPNVAISNREIKHQEIPNHPIHHKKKTNWEPLQETTLYQENEQPIFSFENKPPGKVTSIHTVKMKENILQQSETILNAFQKNNVGIQLIKATLGPVFINYHIRLNQLRNSEAVEKALSDLEIIFNHQNIFLKQPKITLADFELLIPRKTSEPVLLMEIFRSECFSESEQDLIITLGKDTDNRSVLASLEKMPNFLVAGSNYSEIKLAIDAMIASLIAQYTPKKLNIILIGQHNSHLFSYRNLPHLITPLVQQPDTGLKTLAWCLAETQKRLKILQYTHTNHITELNQKIHDTHQKNIFLADPFSEDPDNPKALANIPFLVIIIDHLCWLKSNQSLSIEHLLQQISLYGKEVGVHIILIETELTTQLSHLIQYIFPCRLTFKVPTNIESVLVLNHVDAKTLLGNGDAFFFSKQSNQLSRLQIGTLTEEDYTLLLKHFRTHPIINKEIAVFDSTQSLQKINQDLYDMAVQHILDSQKTTISFLQRKMKIGYNLANQILEQMEKEGILSKATLGGKREILISDRRFLYGKDKK